MKGNAKITAPSRQTWEAATENAREQFEDQVNACCKDYGPQNDHQYLHDQRTRSKE